MSSQTIQMLVHGGPSQRLDAWKAMDEAARFELYLRLLDLTAVNDFTVGSLRALGREAMQTTGTALSVDDIERIRRA